MARSIQIGSRLAAASNFGLECQSMKGGPINRNGNATDGVAQAFAGVMRRSLADPCSLGPERLIRMLAYIRLRKDPDLVEIA